MRNGGAISVGGPQVHNNGVVSLKLGRFNLPHKLRPADFGRSDKFRGPAEAGGGLGRQGEIESRPGREFSNLVKLPGLGPG